MQVSEGLKWYTSKSRIASSKFLPVLCTIPFSTFWKDSCWRQSEFRKTPTQLRLQPSQSPTPKQTPSHTEVPITECCCWITFLSQPHQQCGFALHHLHLHPRQSPAPKCTSTTLHRSGWDWMLLALTLPLEATCGHQQRPQKPWDALDGRRASYRPPKARRKPGGATGGGRALYRPKKAGRVWDRDSVGCLELSLGFKLVLGMCFELEIGVRFTVTVYSQGLSLRTESGVELGAG